MDTYKGRILLVDADPREREFYTTVWNRAGFIATSCPSLGTMREVINKYAYDAIVLDLNLRGEDGLEGLSYIFQHAPFSQVFVLTGTPSIEKALHCMQLGVSWYFTKALPADEITHRLAHFIEEATNARAQPVVSRSWKSSIVGESKAIQELLDTIDRIRSVDSTVLILGESGTGKEVVARAIHQTSMRNAQRFEAINCGAIPEALLESELFGHRKGAFTDAKTDRKGIFELCADGTLLLDEIGDMPLVLQTKLLRVLQEKQVTPVGGSVPIDVRTRVIAATHHEMCDEVEHSNFREDLYYRLSVILIYIPPLRQRREDIPLLVNHFLEKMNQRFGKEIKPPSQTTMSRLQSYDWPGNVRELQNSIERAVVLARSDQLMLEHIFGHIKGRWEGVSHFDGQSEDRFQDLPVFDLPLTDAKHSFERAYLERLLTLTRGNVAELSRRSGRYRADLYRLLDRYQISADDYR